MATLVPIEYWLVLPLACTTIAFFTDSVVLSPIELVTEPEVVLADEPIAEVDSENADLILDALADVSRRGGAVLAATHNPAALSYAGRVVLLRDGAVEATGTPDEMAGHISTD